MSKTYMLRTLADVFDQVPRDRIETCMAELAKGMKYAKSLEELLCATATELGGGKMALQWPETCPWTDDDAQKITIEVHDSDGIQLLTMGIMPNV